MIGSVRFKRGTDADFARGLLAYVRVEYGDLVIDGLTLRRTLEGSLSISWPKRRDRGGNQHAIVRPLTDAARQDVERAILAAMRRQEAS